jgi:hypothetical protein
MSTMTPLRPHFTAPDALTAPRRGWVTTELVATVRRSLEGLIETFETNRIDTSARHGAIVGAAYDAGIRTAVHEALEDIETGLYGDCRTCGDQIAAERLRGVPYARRCAPCQQVEESRWNQFERTMASVIRARVGEPQGRSAHPSPKGCGHPLPDVPTGAR